MKIKYIASSFFLYTLATGINKGMLLISLPMLSGNLSVENYGIWSLSQAFIVLGSAIFSLNGYSAIVRFGITKKHLGYTLFKKYTSYTFYPIITILISYILYGFHWITLTLVLSQLEAFQFLLLGLFRSRDLHLRYFLLSLVKIISILIAISFFNINNVEQLLFIQAIFGCILIFLFYINLSKKFKESEEQKVSMGYFLKFSLFLLPHNISLWVLSSSDRYLIKYFLSDFELGLYGLAYSLALVLMLINSGIALTLPNYVVRNYKEYITSNLKINLILIYSLVAIFVNIFLYFLIKFGKNYIEYLTEVDNDLYEVIVLIFNGIYVLGIYYFYSNILFYHKKAKYISINTIVASVINIILTFFLVKTFGIKGAALATFISYILYFISNMIIACSLEKKLKKDIPMVFGILITTIIINFYVIELLSNLC